MARRLVAFLYIEPSEVQTTGLLMSIAFCNRLARTFLRSATYGLFLATFSAQMLPYIYVAVSMTVVLASFAYLQLAQHALETDPEDGEVLPWPDSSLIDIPMHRAYNHDTPHHTSLGD